MDQKQIKKLSGRIIKKSLANNPWRRQDHSIRSDKGRTKKITAAPDIQYKYQDELTGTATAKMPVRSFNKNYQP